MIKNTMLLFRVVFAFSALAYVGYLNGLLKLSVSDIHRVIICVGLIYAAYSAILQIEAISIRLYLKKRAKKNRR